MSVREPAKGYYADILYDTTCHVALQIIRHVFITDRYHLYETNIDLGPDVNSEAASRNTTLYILAVGVGVAVVAVIAGVRYLRGRGATNQPRYST